MAGILSTVHTLILKTIWGIINNSTLRCETDFTGVE